jgi:hypothetical protein
MSEISELLNAIDHRIAAAQAEITSLEVARSVLVGVGALTGKAPARRSERRNPVSRPRHPATRSGPSAIDAAETQATLG